MLRKKLAAAALTVAAMTSGVVALTAGPALATANDCSWARYTNRSVVAICNGGRGNFPAHIPCHNSGSGPIYVVAYGPWKSVASRSPSYAYCPKANDYYLSGGLDIQ